MSPQEQHDHDAVNHPKHYTSHPSGVECIVVTEHMSFCVGNAVKYLWRVGQKGPAIEDLQKARWYIDREIERVIAKAKATKPPVAADKVDTRDSATAESSSRAVLDRVERAMRRPMELTGE